MKKTLLIIPIILLATSCSPLKTPSDENLNQIQEQPEITSDNLNIENTIVPEQSLTPTASLLPQKTNNTQENVVPSPTSSNIPTSPKITPTETITPSITPIVSLAPSPTPEAEIGIEVGNKAPDFTAQTIDGKEIKLSNYLGKKVFLNFWATWCGPCTREMPSIQKVHENHPDVVILAVNCGEKTEDVKNFIEKNNYTFNVLTDEAGQISYTYYSDYIPLTLIIDENGIITERHVGSLTENEMLKMLNKGE